MLKLEMDKKPVEIAESGELIIKIPRQLMPDLETLSRQRGFNSSREFMAHFVRKQLSLYYKVDMNDFKLQDIK